MEMVTIRSYDNYISAHILVGRLDEEGIPAFLKDEYTVTIDPILTNAIGGIKVQVPLQHQEEALELLGKMEKEYLLSAVCPKCGSAGMDRVVKQVPANFITAILTWLFSSYAVAPEYVYRCSKCGFETPHLPSPAEE